MLQHRAASWIYGEAARFSVPVLHVSYELLTELEYCKALVSWAGSCNVDKLTMDNIPPFVDGNSRWLEGVEKEIENGSFR